MARAYPHIYHHITIKGKVRIDDGGVSRCIALAQNNLRTLHLEELPLISSAALEGLLAEQPHLTSLSILACHGVVGAALLNAMGAPAAQTVGSLDSLALSGCDLTSNDLAKLKRYTKAVDVFTCEVCADVELTQAQCAGKVWPGHPSCPASDVPACATCADTERCATCTMFFCRECVAGVDGPGGQEVLGAMAECEDCNQRSCGGLSCPTISHCATCECSFGVCCRDVMFCVVCQTNNCGECADKCLSCDRTVCESCGELDDDATGNHHMNFCSTCGVSKCSSCCDFTGCESGCGYLYCTDCVHDAAKCCAVWVGTGYTRNGADGNQTSSEQAKFFFHKDGMMTGRIIYGSGSAYNPAETTQIYGHHNFTGTVARPTADFTQWEEGDQFWYTESYHGGASTFYYSGKLQGDKMEGRYKMGGVFSTGTFIWVYSSNLTKLSL